MNKKMNIKLVGKNLVLGTIIAGSVFGSGIGAFANTTARCQETYDAWVTASSTYIKVAPNAKSTKLASVFRGEQVEIIGHEGDYSKLAFGSRNEKIGYIPDKYLSATPLNNMDKSIKKVMHVNIDRLKMRKTASMGVALGEIHTGYKVEIDESVKATKTWIKCSGYIKPNGQTVKMKFWVAKRYLSEVGSTTVAKPQQTLAPVVTKESVTVVNAGAVYDINGKFLFNLKKGDKVTPVGEDQGIDKTRIELNNGSMGVIHKTMIIKDFHTHDEFVAGRPCNTSNLGQSLKLIEYKLTRDIVVVNSDCEYYSEAVTVPAGTVIDIALDRYNDSTKNVEVHYRFKNKAGKVIDGQGFTLKSQFNLAKYK